MSVFLNFIFPILPIYLDTSDVYLTFSIYILGNCCFKKDDIEKAKELYDVALENDASCVEALYNLRYLVYDVALQRMMRRRPVQSQVVYDMALGNNASCVEALYNLRYLVYDVIEWCLLRRSPVQSQVVYDVALENDASCVQALYISVQSQLVGIWRSTIENDASCVEALYNLR